VNPALSHLRAPDLTGSQRRDTFSGDNADEADMKELKIPDELSAALEAAAERKGKTVDEVAAEALKRYIAHEKLDELTRYGEERAKELGLDKLTEEEREEYVNRVIQESRNETRSR
jgi:uncharacterized protein YdeI (YjbR/CyaY-like superfamily)